MRIFSQHSFGSDHLAGRRVLLFLAAALVVPAGCTNHDPAPANLAAPPPAVSITPRFRPESAAPQTITIVEDDPQLVHVRVQTGDGGSFYVHRSFVRKSGDAVTLLTAADLLNKPAGEDYYFTLDEIGQVRDKVPGLYRTLSGREVVAPWKTPQFEYNGEWAWPVYECLKPDCPGRDPAAEHGVLFILADPKFAPGADFARMEAQRERAESAGPLSHEAKLAATHFLCPECRKQGRPMASEAFAQPFRRYRLPESEAMWKELDAEYTRSREVRVRKFSGGSQ